MKHLVSVIDIRGHPLTKLIESCLSEFDSQYKGSTYWISIEFNRPMGDAKLNKDAIKKNLTAFLDKPFPLPCEIKVTDNISFYIEASQAVKDKVFQISGLDDDDSGGWVLSEFIKNFKHCIEDKTKKITAPHKYNSWWLVLMDHIAHNLEKSEIEEVKLAVSASTAWNKIIVLDRLTGNNILEI